MMRRSPVIIALAAAAMLPLPARAAMTPEQRAAILVPTEVFSEAERWETLPGGSATNRTIFGRNAFSQPSASLSFEERADFFIGNGLFRRNWVTAPSSTQRPMVSARSTTPAAASAAI